MQRYRTGSWTLVHGPLRRPACWLALSLALVGLAGLPGAAHAQSSAHAARPAASDGLDTGLVLGDRIFRDLDNDGLYEPGAGEFGIAAVSLKLYADDGDGVLDAGDGAPIASTNSVAGGVYSFNVPTGGEYIVQVDPANLASGGVLAGLFSSGGNEVGGQAPDPDDDVDHDDNGYAIAGFGVASKAITMTAGQEPGGDGNNTLDFGFRCQLCVGDRIFKDYDNDGVWDQNPNEPGIDNVTVNLYKDDGDGVLDAGDGAPVATQQTANGGLYHFCDLGNGAYIVEVDVAEFAAGGTLVNHTSSLQGAVAPDPDDDVDNDDNGQPVAGFGVATKAVTLTCGGEPDKPEDGDGVDSNRTVDLGFACPVALGNLIFKDLDNDGLFEPGNGEFGIDGVDVNLYLDDGDGVLDAGDGAPIANTTSAGGGVYSFGNLLPGNYIVEVDAAELAAGGSLAGMPNSDGNDPAPDPDNDVDDDDNGTPVAGFGVASGAITLVPGGEPTTDGDGNPNTNFTDDFGFYNAPTPTPSPTNTPAPKLSLGNLVFKDLDNDGLFEPGNGEFPVDGVLLNLYADDGDGVLDAGDGAPIASQTTAGGGSYQFTNLDPGDYIVEVDASEFLAGGTLENMPSSTGNDPAPDPDNDVNNDDNGTPVAGFGVASQAVTLSSGGEPTNDGDSDPNSNLTVDFGFLPTLSLGNKVFKDLDNDGLFEPGSGEFGIDGVDLKLWIDGNGDGTPDIDTGKTTTTAGGGMYQFTGLTEGIYIVEVLAGNFNAGGALFDMPSSPASPDADNNTDNDDNGLPGGGGNVISTPVTLTVGQEPTGDDDTDPNSNNTVDLGFVNPPTPTPSNTPTETPSPTATPTNTPAPKLSLGNLVFKDLDNDGLFEPGNGEFPVDGVLMNLYADDGDGVLDAGDGAPIATMATAGGGAYQFTNLDPGSYIVEVAASNFAAGGTLENMPSSTGNDPAPDPDNDVNNDDNGTPVAGFGVASPAVILTSGGEPTNDGDGDPNSNLTVDFGFLPTLSLGNLVFKDLDNDGLYEPGDGEFGINGVQLKLWIDSNTDGTPDIDTGKTTTTAGGGAYQFTGLTEGSYIVEVLASNFAAGGALQDMPSSPGGPGANNNTDNDDNGVPGAGGNVISTPITLTVGQEPTDDADTDPNTNTTLDLGFVNLPTPTPTSTATNTPTPTNTPFTGNDKLAALGNRIFKDLDGDGIFEPGSGEFGIDGVVLALWLDTNVDGTPDVNTGLATISSGGGFYQFVALDPGTYIVQVLPSNFNPGGPLFDMPSSPGSPDANNDVDNDDNGKPVSGLGVISTPITVVPDNEPVSEDGNPNTNLTLDFGFVNLPTPTPSPTAVPQPGIALQKTVYLGHNLGNSCPGVDILWAVNGTALTYCFEVTNTGNTHLNNITLVDPNLGITRAQMTLKSGTEPLAPGAKLLFYYQTTMAGDLINTATTEGTPSTPDGTPIPGLPKPKASDSAQVETVVKPATLCLGGTLFKDLNNDGVFQPGNGEFVLGVVKVNLWKERDGNNGLSAGDMFIGSQTTDVNGHYNFCDLVEGEYIVEIDLANFGPGGRLEGMPTSTGNDPAPDPDDNVDNDDNGSDVPGFGVASKPITLTGGNEPTNDGDDNNGNQTVDFGFLCPLCLGDRVFKDLDDDGLYEPASGETGIDGVKLNLYEDRNTNNILDAADGAPIASTTTASGGLYEFCGLSNRDYIVQADASNFAAGGALEGLLTSSGNEVGGQAPDPDNDIDHDDNGYNVAGFGVATKAVSLRCGTEPDKPVDGDGVDSNRTVDLGFIMVNNLCLGNQIFFDLDNDGVYEPLSGEFPIPGVKLNLYRDVNGSGSLDAGDGAALATQNSDAQGRYKFCNLMPGNYIVQVDTSNFNSGAVLDGIESSTGNDVGGQAPDPDNDLDNDDNGFVIPIFGVVSKPVTLSPLGEPGPGVDGDDSNSNSTVDFGFKQIPPPTSVQVLSLDARGVQVGTAKQVELRWTTAGEEGLVGFNVLVATHPKGPWTQVNQTLIPGSDRRGGASYRFSDKPETLGLRFYAIQVLEEDGDRWQFGPARVDLSGIQRLLRLFLPTLSR